MKVLVLLLVLLCTCAPGLVIAKRSAGSPPPAPKKHSTRTMHTSNSRRKKDIFGPEGAHTSPNHRFPGPNKAGHKHNISTWALKKLRGQRTSRGARSDPLSSTGVTVVPPLKNNGAGEPKAGNKTMDGGLSFRPAPDGVERPFKIAFYNAMDLSQSEDMVKYVMGELVPAAASLYRRHMRVRYPSGKLRFHGRKDLQGQPIPAGPNGEGVLRFTQLSAGSVSV